MTGGCDDQPSRSQSTTAPEDQEAPEEPRGQAAARWPVRAHLSRARGPARRRPRSWASARPSSASAGFRCGSPRTDAHERRDGDLLLRVEGSVRYGLPYGQDRLFILLLCSAFHAVGQPRDNRIWFRHLSDLPQAFGIPADGHERELWKERILRVCHAHFIVEEISRGGMRFRFWQLVDEARALLPRTRSGATPTWPGRTTSSSTGASPTRCATTACPSTSRR